MARSKTIWYISKYASPQKYFFGTRHFYFAEEWVKQGHTVCVFTSNTSHLTDALPRFEGSHMVEDINGVTTVWVDTPRYTTSDAWQRMLSWLLFEWRLLTMRKDAFAPPDIVIASSLSLLSVLSGYLLARRYGARFIFEVRDIWPLSVVELSGYSPRHPFIRVLAAVERFGYRKADVIVGTMPNLREHVAAVAPAEAEKVTCIPQGVSLDFYASQERLPEGYVETHLPGDSFCVGYAGTINANNPMETLVAAGRLLVDQGVDIVILGKGSQKAHLQALAADLPNVHFLDAIPKAQVAHFLSHMDVCYDAFSSVLGRYGLSRNKWIDYLHAGKPVICSFDGYQSMINEADAGCFVAFGDAEALAGAILRLKALPAEERAVMGRRAHDFVVRERAFPKLARAYADLFDA